jgi:serine protease
MRRRAIYSLIAVVCALLPAAAHADETPRPAWSASGAQTPAPAAGLIVSADAPVSRGVLNRAAALLGRAIVGQSELGGSLIALRFDRPLPTPVVRSLGRALSALPEIGSVTPDLVVTPDALPNDTYFAQQTNLWSPPVTPDDTGSSGGTYSIDAPTMWSSTTGKKSVVVAVVDGGIIRHPDLDGQAVAGYDMISDPRISQDGNGRDNNPTDPGNWSDGTYCTAHPSIWHGSHVAGIIAAKRNNGIGIAGIAPGVSLQPVRAIGTCGGTMSDIIASIRWASGGHVTGVPDNKTPADVINLSLSSSVSDYSCPAAYQSVIDEAHARGAVIVVSAGNQSKSVLTRTPSNCAHVLSVGATGPDGNPTTYTNAGETIGIMAPGGLLPSQGAGIWSTVDAGTKRASSPTYGELSGTSMSAPAVSAAVALVRSLGSFTADEAVEVIKTAAVRPPTSDGYYTCFSTDSRGVEHNVCGAGILNLAAIPAPVGRPVLSGGSTVGSVVSLTPNTWNGHPDSVTHQWLRNGVAITGATGTGYTLVGSDLGTTLTVRSTAHSAAYPDFSVLSAARAVPKASAAVSLRLSSTHARVKTTRLYAYVTVKASQGQSSSGTVVMYVDGRRVAVVAVSGGLTASVRLPVFGTTGTHKVRAYFAGNLRVAARWSTTLLVTVTK